MHVPTVKMMLRFSAEGETRDVILEDYPKIEEMKSYDFDHIVIGEYPFDHHEEVGRASIQNKNTDSLNYSYVYNERKNYTKVKMIPILEFDGMYFEGLKPFKINQDNDV